MLSIPFGRPMAAKRTNKNQRIFCPLNKKALPLPKEIHNITQLNTNKTKNLVMKKILLSMLGLIFLTLSINAQQAQSYSGHKSYATMGGRVGGNEQYTYLVDDRGKTIIHGKYTYSGVNHVETNTEKIDAKYAMDLNCKNGFLDGNLTINGNYTSEEFIWTEGWKKASATTKLSGVFKDGKPNGLFSITYQDKMKGAASATLKNGKYIGAYSFQGYVSRRSGGAYDYQHWYVMKGQLTDDGKLTGQWLYDTQLDTYNYTFINDVLISETHEKYTTPPRVQEIAKKYANKQITKEEVLAQGFFLQEDSIPLNYFVSGYILKQEFNLYEIGAFYDFSEWMVAKKFTKIVELNMLSKAGFELLKENLEKMKYGYRGLNKYNREVTLCSFPMGYDEEYDANFLSCDEYFTEKYGTKVTGEYQDQKIYLTPSQAKEWQNLLKNRALKNIKGFEYFLYELRRWSDTEELRTAYNHYINNTLTEWLYEINNAKYLKEDLSKLINSIETNTLVEGSFKVTEDEEYIIPASSISYYDCAYTNRVDILKEILSLVDQICKYKEDYKKAQEQDNLLKEQFATYKDLAIVISIMYQINDAPIIQNLLDAENECNKLDSIMRIQDQMFEYIANRKLVEQLHAEIITICSSYKGCAKAYKTFSKNYPVIWNTEKDNNKYIKDVLSMLQEIKSTLTNQENLPQIDNALKKAKTLDEIKSLFRISK